MLLTVRIHPSAKQERIIELDNKRLEVAVKEEAAGGEANRRLLALLQQHFGSDSIVRLIRGHHRRSKIVSVEPKKLQA